MSFEVNGKLHVKYDAVQVSERFKKREFVLEIGDGMYPQHVKFQLTQDKTSVLDPFEVGDSIQVSFDLRGREYTNPKGEVMYFTNLNAWRVQKAGANTQQAAPPPSSEGASFPSANDEPAGSPDNQLDDLPF